MVLVVLLRLEVFFWICIEFPFASSRAEIIRLPLVFGFASGGLGINVHATYRIFYHNEVLSWIRMTQLYSFFIK
jgi:hypothetical protein